MCGIVAAVAQRQVLGILLEGLRRLEYRGYDSAGVSLIGDDGEIGSCKREGKVAELEAALEAAQLEGGRDSRLETHD